MLRPLLAAALAAVTLAGPAFAQAFPAKPIELIVPYPPGGAADIIGRLAAKEMEPLLGQPVVVLNKAGAGTIIGAQAAAGAKADGYTLFISSNTTFSMNPAVHEKLPYDSARQFEPIGMVGAIGLAVLANPAAPYPTLASLVEAAKAKPGAISYASFGNATTSHFAAEMFLQRAGINLLHVPYKGSSPAMTDLIGGVVPISVDTVTATLPQLKAGKVKALAVTSARRSQFLPEVPTIAESGYAGFDLTAWVAIVAPKGLPKDARDTLRRALEKALAAPEFKAKLAQSGVEAGFLPLDDWEAFVTADTARMKAVATKANIKAE